MQSQKQNLRVSIVIPAYNEAATLGACLEAIMAQTVKPFEVIVVDNNSSDETVEIARSYNFVKLLHEPRQGVIYARNTGFDYAHGAIIGRIDADTVISENWVETLQAIFSSRSVDAVSGSMRYYDMSLAPVANRLDLLMRRHMARMLRSAVALQGANMGIRKSTWRAIRGSLCHGGGLHEDMDINIHANALGYKMKFDESLQASLALRQAQSSFSDFVDYAMMSPRTYAAHGLKVQRHMYPVVGIAIAMYVPIKVLHHGYDPATQRFSLDKLIGVRESARVNPATFVD